ncbi:SurA N-terminal domain-containing protein [Aliiroseovarius marinus]|uniref:peptidylprolyl isomerase n=1 Tax=Aliiroseovarius marinus TaxID=2500159 RepID=UPI003D7EE207
MATGKTSRTFGWILMGLVMVGLVGFGSTNFGAGGSAIGTVGKTEISAGRYARELQNEIRAFEAQTGQPMTMVQAQAFGLDQQVLGRVIAAAALEDETAELGLSVGDSELRDRIVEIPAFAGVDGKFDREGYAYALQQSGLSTAEFEESLRAEVSRQILQAAVANGITTNPAYVDTLYGYAREARNFTWGALPLSQLTAQLPEPTAEELTAHYDANPARFTLPETKKITYAWLNPEDLIAGIEVAEADIKALYESRLDEFVKPERRMVERLVFGSDADAQAAADAIAAGEKSFDDVVAERDLALEDIDLGDLTRAELGDAGDAVFALEGPGVAGPAQSEFGPALYRMNAVLAAREATLDDVRSELHGELAADAARRQAGDMVAELDDLMAGGATLEEIADSHKLRLGTLDWTADSTGGIAAYEKFREAAQAAQEGDFPEIVILSDGGLFALRLDQHIEPRLQAEDEVQDAVRDGWAAAKRLELLADQARAMIPKLEGGESLASLGLTEVVEDAQERDSFIEGTPPALITEVFAAEKGDWIVVPAETSVFLARVDAVIEAEQTTPEALALKEGFAAQTAQEIALDVEIAFSRAVQSRAGIALDRAVINAVNAQIQ